MDPAERKRNILQAAKVVFAEKGYHDAGVADIIKEAGIARGTFYLYFKSKAEVFSALVENIIQSVVEQLIQPSFDDESTILGIFKNNIEKLRSFFVDDTDAAKILIHETFALDPEAREQFGNMRYRLVMWMVDLVSEAQKRGILRPLNPEILAFGFMGVLKEIFEGYLVSGYLKTDLDQIATEVLDLYMFGLITPEFQQLAKENFKAVSDREDDDNKE